MNISDMKLEDFLKTPVVCNCGHQHRINLKCAKIGFGVINELPQIIKTAGYHKAFIVADQNTYKAAGNKVIDALKKAEIPYKLLILMGDTIIPDEAIIGSVMMAYEESCDFAIAIGTGTINDIVKYFSFKIKLPYYIVATAPSMDGFISVSAAMITNNLKITYDAHVPEVFIGDLEVLTAAPMSMIAAGFGDIMGKYTCLQDWKLSAIINNEYYCETVKEIMALAVQRTIESGKDLLNRDQEAIKKLTEALLLSGIAMSFVGNSRPASGSEHHMSHFWEMQFQYEGKKPVLHGTKVGIGTIISLKLYEFLKNEKIDFTKARNESNFPTYEAWVNEINRVFPAVADDIILLEKQAGKNTIEHKNARINTIEEHWNDIKEVLEATPQVEKLEELLLNMKAPTRPIQVGIDKTLVKDSILYAKEVRNRYTILQLLWDLALLEKYADRVVEFLFDNNDINKI